MREVSPDRDPQASEELSDGGELSSLSETDVPSIKPRRWRRSPEPSEATWTPAAEPRTPPLVPIGGSPRKAASHINDLPPELLREILKMIDTEDRLQFMLVQRRWLAIALSGVWMRPYFTHARTLNTVSMLLAAHARQLESPQPFPVTTTNYARLIRRLSLSSVAEHVSDAVLLPFAECTNLDRLILGGCRHVSQAVICRLLERNPQLHSLDLLGTRVGDEAALTIASSCPELTTVFIGSDVTDSGLAALLAGCPQLRRLRLAEAPLITRRSLVGIDACRQLNELDISALDPMQDATDQLTDNDLAVLLARLPLLRDLKLDCNMNLSRHAFEPLLEAGVRLENLRLLSLAMCPRLTDSAVLTITRVAPRLRHLVLNKCMSITDRGLHYLSDAYGPNLQYLHLGHCGNITDAGIALLADRCPRLFFVDVANCTNLTNASVRELAKLHRLRRIGLVKCSQIDDGGILALTERLPSENMLERIHLSYCLDVSVGAITRLLNACPKLTHLSLTGVHSFLSPELMQFRREAPQDLSQHQQRVFCVYSGQGVRDLRNFLNDRLLEDEQIRQPHLSPIRIEPSAAALLFEQFNGLPDRDMPEIAAWRQTNQMLALEMFERGEGLQSPILIDGHVVRTDVNDSEGEP